MKSPIGSHQAIDEKTPQIVPFEFEDDGEDENMNDLISKGALNTNVVHIKLIDSNRDSNLARDLMIFTS